MEYINHIKELLNKHRTSDVPHYEEPIIKDNSSKIELELTIAENIAKKKERLRGKNVKHINFEQPERNIFTDNIFVNNQQSPED